MKTSEILLDDQENKSGNPVTVANLYDLLINELKGIYWVEKELTGAIPKMVEKATDQNLKTALAKHLAETKDHVKRVEDVFDEFELEHEAVKCDAIAAMIKGAEEIMDKTPVGEVRDAAIILAAQKVEHFEIAIYGALISYAQILNEDKVAAWFKDTLDEEFGADNKLSDISRNVNVKADKSENGTNSKIQYS